MGYLTWAVCHPWDRSCCNLPNYQIWSFYPHTLRRYKRQYKVWRLGWFEVVWTLESHKVTGNSIILYSICQFMLAAHCNGVPI